MECENEQRFINIPEYTYILVGTNPDCDKLIDIKYIRACDYEKNIEDKKQFVAFTAWWLLVKNPELIKDDYVCLLEYDSYPHEGFVLALQDKTDYDVIQFLPIPISDDLFNKVFPIVELFRDIFEIDIIPVLKEATERNIMWGASSNQAMKREVLIDFVNWYEKYIAFIEDYTYCKYIHERVFMLYILHKRYGIYNTNNLTHFYKDSHNAG